MLILNIPFIAANINTLVFNLRSYFVTKRLQISIGKIKAHGSSAMYGAQNEAYNVKRGRKTPKAVYLQRVARVEAMRSSQNETFT